MFDAQYLAERESFGPYYYLTSAGEWWRDGCRSGPPPADYRHVGTGDDGTQSWRCPRWVAWWERVHGGPLPSEEVRP